MLPHNSYMSSTVKAYHNGIVWVCFKIPNLLQIHDGIECYCYWSDIPKSNCMCRIFFFFLDLLLIFRISYKFILLTYNSLPIPSITTLCAPLKINIIKLLASVGWNYCWCWTVFCRLAMICFSGCLGLLMYTMAYFGILGVI